MSETLVTERGLVYEVAGDGPAVLLIHAGIADRRMWEPQWLAWRDRFTLIRYDIRGFGESPDPAGEHSLHADAVSILDAAGIERAAVVGASIGGRAAIDLAIVHPERVTALLAVGATPSGWEHEAELLTAFEAVEEAYGRGGIDAANEVELRIWVDGPRRGPEEVDSSVRGQVSRMNLDALAREESRELDGTDAIATELRPPAFERLTELAMPALVVIGELDQPSVNAGATALAEAVAGARVETIPNAAHLPSLERPAEFDAVALPFLERAWSG